MHSKSNALNAICPYFTMFPLEFPLLALQKKAKQGDWVLDPFCGRGTTVYAARVLGLPSIGIDSNIVAAAIAQAKLTNTTPEEILKALRDILVQSKEPVNVPSGDFWQWAFEESVLETICRLREGLLIDSPSDARKALRAILLGALHGPRGKIYQSYFSNQSPRTFAPKPDYAVRFWKKRGVKPQKVDVSEIVQRRAERYYSSEETTGNGLVIHGDSRDPLIWEQLRGKKIKWIITSPPYYGMNTYLPDQWLRLWFLGGSEKIVYTMDDKQISHNGTNKFVGDLKAVWKNASETSTSDANLIIRFGAINTRKADPIEIIKMSLKDSGWSFNSMTPAGNASKGHRQALHFLPDSKSALEEYDVLCTRVQA